MKLKDYEERHAGAAHAQKVEAAVASGDFRAYLEACDALEVCPNCGQPDPNEDHYDAWSDWGDGEGPDGWTCTPTPTDTL